MYYLLVCRVALGHHVRTKESGGNATSMDSGQKVFAEGGKRGATNTRELAAVPGVTPPVNYHSLLADVLDVGYRYREVVVFHSEYVYPEYLIAYQRVEESRSLYPTL